MHCFVTGASGFVGGALAERILREGHSVTALSQDERRTSDLEALGGRIVRGLPESLESGAAALLAGVDVLFHCDAFLHPRATSQIYREANVLGTRRVLDAAVAAGVPRMVHLSSQSVVWDGRSQLDDSTPYPDAHLDPYSASRAEAERLVLVAARAGRIEAAAVRPGWTWGPGDNLLLPLLVRRALRGPIPLVGHGEHLTAITYIDHLVDALIACGVAPDVSGKAYFVSDDEGLTQRAFIDLQLSAVGVVASFRTIPAMVARAAAAVVEAAGPWVGTPLPLLRLVAGMASGELTHDTSRARQDLGYRSRISLEEGAARLRAWCAMLGGIEAVAALRPEPGEPPPEPARSPPGE